MNIPKISNQSFGNIHLSKELKNFIVKHRPTDIENDIKYRKDIEELEKRLNTGNDNCKFTLNVKGYAREGYTIPAEFHSEMTTGGLDESYIPEEYRPPQTCVDLYLDEHKLATIFETEEYDLPASDGDFNIILFCILTAIKGIDLKRKEIELLEQKKEEQKREKIRAEIEADNDKFYKSFLAK